jgi:DNA helicase-2/ATP-dependent DNA helicase PcrA
LINSTIQNTESKIEISKSGILARAHAILSGFRSHPTSGLSKIELFANGLNCWANNPRTGKDMQNALQQIGKCISMLAYDGNGNHQHQYCPDAYNQIEWRNQLSDLIVKATNTLTGVYPFASLTWSQWVAKLKPFLENYWVNFRSPTNYWDSVKAKIKSPNGSATKLVIDTIKASQNNYSEKIRMTTFHDVKGETLDAVLIVSAKDKKSNGGHFEQWLSQEADEKEFVRFAYVASSRPKHLLIWAIPKIADNQFINKIKDLGFETE